MAMSVPLPASLDVPLGEAALAWAANGWRVFPIVPRGKTPYGQGEFCGRHDAHSCGFHCATTEQEALAAWWAAHPDSNIGITAPDAFVVDEDRLGALVDAGVTLPRCPFATTGRAGGGRHFFLRAPEGWEGLEGDAVKVTYKVPAVEVKGFGKGYVVAAPSIHSSGNRYALEKGGHVPEAPRAVMDKLVTVDRVANPGSPLLTVTAGYAIPPTVGQGGRYEAVRSYVAHLYNRDFSVEEMWAQVVTNLAPVFSPRLTSRELRERFERATKDMEKGLGPRRLQNARPGAAPIPTLLEDAPLTEYESAPVEWVWRSWLPKGVVTIMDGNPGVSKSTLVADLVARLTMGTSWPDGSLIEHPIRAMWITTEDDPGRVLRPRIEAAGGDPAMVLFVQSEVVFPAAATAFQELLVRRASEPLGLGLVVLDPLFSHIEASVRTIADAEMRRGVMNPLTHAAEAAKVSVLVVRHFSKDTAASAINRGAGSLGGIVGAARAQWSVTTDPEDDSGETKAVGVAKLNYARTPPTLRYQVVDRVPPGWVTGSVSGIEWLGPSPLPIAAILADTPRGREAEKPLRELLARGPMPAEQVYVEMKARGFGRDATRSARARIGAKANKSGMAGGWVWSLPEESEESELTNRLDGVPSPVSSEPSRAGARAGRHTAHDSSASSEEEPSVRSDGSDATGGSSRAGAREDAERTVRCAFYTDHQTRHERRPDGRFICPICAPEEATA